MRTMLEPCRQNKKVTSPSSCIKINTNSTEKFSTGDERDEHSRSGFSSDHQILRSIIKNWIHSTCSKQ